MNEIKLPYIPVWMEHFLLPPDGDGGEDTVLADRMRTYAKEAVQDCQRQLSALTEDYKDLEAQLLAVGAGGVSKLIGDSE